MLVWKKKQKLQEEEELRKMSNLVAKVQCPLCKRYTYIPLERTVVCKHPCRTRLYMYKIRDKYRVRARNPEFPSVRREKEIPVEIYELP